MKLAQTSHETVSFYKCELKSCILLPILQHLFIFSDELIQQQQARASVVGEIRNDLNQEI